MENYIAVMLPIILPILLGLFVLINPVYKHNRWFLIGTIIASGVLIVAVTVSALDLENAEYTLFYLTSALPVDFKIDVLGRFFTVIVTTCWIAETVFSFRYLPENETERRFHGFNLIVLGILYALGFSGNLMTFYMFYELMTILSMPLVIHTMDHEAVMAGLKYLFFSFAGAYCALFGFYFVQHDLNIAFTEGGSASVALLGDKAPFMLAVAFIMILGFGVKAGLFPMHGWLPTAHPVAPAPASAFLSGIIVKMGVLGTIRTVYYIFGADFLRGTWVQYTWMGLALFTVFMGSMLAYREKILKKRLAYSTVSQLSYILFGLAAMDANAAEGALLHVLAHAFIKSTLFLCAGAMIHATGKIRVEDFKGIGKKMPITLWCFTIASLGLIGIPPTAGFISKWYLCVGALRSPLGSLSYLGPVVLLVSAALTAGYLLPITIHGFLPGRDAVVDTEPVHEHKTMVGPMIALMVLMLFAGLFPGYIMQFIDAAVSGFGL